VVERTGVPGLGALGAVAEGAVTAGSIYVPGAILVHPVDVKMVWVSTVIQRYANQWNGMLAVLRPAFAAGLRVDDVGAVCP
jgi:hypothetical protein